MAFASTTPLSLRSSSSALTLDLFCTFPATARTSAACLQLLRPLTSTSSLQLQCNAIFRPRTEEYIDVIENGLPVIKWHEIVEDDAAEKDSLVEEELLVSDKISELVAVVRSILRSMGDGEISISPYDTAWAALVEDAGSGTATRRPQFPMTLDWISNNQLHDGSWGDRTTFSIFDRIINTLACVVALTSWDLHSDKIHKGISFMKKNMSRLEEENEEHMPIGFEVALPSLIDIAKDLQIDIPTDTKGLREIYAKREIKLKKIPKDVLHQLPTTLLHSLEGMTGLIWQKLLKLQSEDGSFLFSPSSTAFALQQTKDDNCLKYLTNHIHKFNGGVPNVYPVDLFEHLWAVDRLQRLGVSRYFKTEIEECVAYVHRYWTEKGICWARNSEVQDIDDTAMGFRLLRLHGYEVSADVFKHFESGGEFFCFKGQSTQAVTGMYNLYRASQIMFPGENILQNAAHFSSQFLQTKRANNELFDKWIITKDLPGEVGYALDVPWYASLPRVEARFYLQQYGGEDDVWIGKTLYRMPYVNNNKYLELAKVDYNNCQALHQQEWRNIQRWYRSCELGEDGLSEESLLQAYYVAAASVFEPEKSQERIAWAKTAILMQTIKSHFELHHFSSHQKTTFLDEFERTSTFNYAANGGRYKTRTTLVGTLLRTLNQLSLNILLAHGRDIHQQLKNAWYEWLMTSKAESGAELLVRMLNLSGRRGWEESLLSHPKYEQLSKATVDVCDKLCLFRPQKDGNGCMTDAGGITTSEIESEMQGLVKLVVTRSCDLDYEIKQNFLTIAKSFYYAAYCNQGTINFHISKVLFERVL
uniref:Terpene synthase 15 n=1 Tax=Prunella vulgaris TaxID=39358 RepID=A0A6B7L8X6_PRUVU|nr:terpene synthase 15 [Prunella vulgaris]